VQGWLSKARLVLRVEEVMCWSAQNITGKICLVTGASTGIGRASADRLAAAGAVVVGAQHSLRLACVQLIVYQLHSPALQAGASSC
jgi:2-hydroxycyclohexanecarboxyl-CoA dehydrogenase